MMGAIAGDVIGSYDETFATKAVDFQPLFHKHSRFNVDTVLTVAVADWTLNGGDLVDLLHDYYHSFPAAGHGGLSSVGLRLGIASHTTASETVRQCESARVPVECSPRADACVMSF